MPTRDDHLVRLAEIGQERVNLITRLQILETEQTGIVAKLATTQEAQPPVAEPTTRTGRRRGVVPLPVGSPIKRRELDALKTKINGMDPSAFGTVGRDLIREWYPKLAKTPAWHEISTALQKHFGAKRQQVAAYAAHKAREVGEAHVNAQEAHA